GFHHFFRGGEQDGDLVYFQPHSAPGVYARAFLEGRLPEEALANFRQETGGRGLCSYPHPWLMPRFWQFPTGSMGLGPLTAVYQARFMRYLEHRGVIPASSRKVWAFAGDGEMDEPESLAGLALAAREQLDNLIFVVNCNLQRLDGPVRGNGSIIKELERVFRGAGWNVIKLMWGSDWDLLFELDCEGVLRRRLEETVDGEMQSYGANDGRFNRERFFDKYPELSRLVAHLSDEQIDNLTRGGHDPVKIHAAFDAARRHEGQPTVVLAHTKKGYGLGRWAESRMSAHQQKKLDDEALLWFRNRFALPLTDQQALEPCFYKPPKGDPAMQYLLRRRNELGGFVPARRSPVPMDCEIPDRAAFAPFSIVAEAREMSTTVAFMRMLQALLKAKPFGRRIVPIVADEARTFGMQPLFRSVGIYSPNGQMYTPEDHADFLHYKESRDGQILEEGITEAGALSSWIAAGTTASNHGSAMLPVFVFYSIFGFQRVGDLIWAAADSRARGFLVGATSGRTTLSGEGLQHQDGTSQLIASTIPTCRAYDPCYAHELAIVVEHGMRAMLGADGRDVFYYLTVTNENYAHPQPPAGCEEGVLRGMYRLRQTGSGTDGPRVQLLGSGAILREVEAAAELLSAAGVASDIWSVTSFTELRWDAMRRSRAGETPWVTECLAGADAGPVIAATDYVRSVPDLIRAWVPRTFHTLGTDGFGRSDRRAALRRFFEVDSVTIAVAALRALAREGRIEERRVHEFRQAHGHEDAARPPWEC
ncbi:MAG: pyruvate dehydrogenase (acetyl-transferring), homodimeric type, partial [Acidobacteria bacterium]|nr:pyruvate dehydrogenase (acetyl-transferring), homodimeric type [Acidobacteriota bacterium]